jgi:hypothetical protein
MRWIVLIVAVVMACIAVLLLSQQRVLWDVTEPGMTVADVRAVLPEAAPPAQPRRLDNGLTLGLVAPNVSNFDRAFDAELYFDDDGLQQVLLRATRLLTERVAMMEFDELRHAATLRYGRELPGISTSLDSVLAEARWRAGPVTIMLRVEKRGALAAVTMTYEAGV